MNHAEYVKLKKRVILLHKIQTLQDRVPFIVLIFAALIGTLTGIIGVAFQYAVNWIGTYRTTVSLAFFSSFYLNLLISVVLSALMASLAYFLVKRYAPESGGSGIPEIEGALENKRPVRWRRVLPVKFLSGLGALGSGMILGREGPTVQIGGNVGKMVFDLFRMKKDDYRHIFISTGAAAGITVAFNAPLAGIIFIIEEMREQFRFSNTSIKAVGVGVIMACLMYQILMSPSALFQIGTFHAAPLESLWIYIVFGVILGLAGVLFNQTILVSQTYFQKFYQKGKYYFIFTGTAIGALFGLLTLVVPTITGSGFAFVPPAIAGHYLFNTLCYIFILRFMLTVMCFSSGAPGGIFSPTLALGTAAGLIFGTLMQSSFPEYQIELGAFAIIGMSGLFASTIRAPLTGIVLVIEMTSNYQLIIPMIITCLASTFIAQALNSQPLYSAILARTLKKQQDSTL
ncbi:CIC family chloride channel protein [Orbus hercynius]|uniref:CIC family chloride channel protein n=1 Tax=Orbus hercynius TaxID=593135 RepID=A0A495RI97_9GAMM|nr:H(+)/Cl(-) exchange transporter ClcA [Orbus hercynius]RKS87131.1 CIC family chloride channel protein [Orbus hercynius]